MGAAKLTPAEWHEVRLASEAGMDDDELAQTFNVTKNAIQQRKHREKWLTPRKLKEMAMVQEAKDKAKGLTNSVAVRAVSEEGTALATLSSKLAKMKEEAPVYIAEKVLDLIKTSLEGNLIPAPKSAKDLSTLTGVFGNMVGINKGGGMVIQVGGAAWGASQAPEKPKIVVLEAQEV